MENVTARPGRPAKHGLNAGSGGTALCHADGRTRTSTPILPFFFFFFFFFFFKDDGFAPQLPIRDASTMSLPPIASTRARQISTAQTVIAARFAARAQ
jgi:hypothetical protein